MSSNNVLVLTVECENRVGIVHAISGFLSTRQCNIIDSQQFDDKQSGKFYMRVETEVPEGIEAEELRTQFEGIADVYDMSWSLNPVTARVRTVIMVSHTDHCINELINLWQNDYLNIEIVAVVSNHETLRPVAEHAGLPFHHVPVTAATKEAAEAELMRIFEEVDGELIVLARYMQILSDAFCAQLPNQVINIHHSFLPGFKGAKPYHQAYERGVKVIGATAHYVTADLDEGPIITQSVFPVDHRSTPDDLRIAGRRAERDALALAVGLHAERRVFVSNARTVIFH